MIDTPKITLLFGKICSGKSTYADALCYVTKAKRITVSDIVKRLSGMTSRSQLSTTADLDKGIAIELCKEIKRYDKVVVDGIRQYSIAHYTHYLYHFCLFLTRLKLVELIPIALSLDSPLYTVL